MDTRRLTKGEQKLLAKTIKEAIEESGYKYKELAPKLGLTYDKLNNIANNRTAVAPEIIAALRIELGKPPTWPPFDESDNVSGRRVNIVGTKMLPIPVIGYAQAGAGLTNVDVDETDVYVPEKLAQIGGMGWIVDGSSMEPYLEAGDVAIFREHRNPRRGYPFLVRRDGQYRVKVIEWRDGWELRSTNPQYAAEPLDDWELLGYLIGWYRLRGTRETLDSDPNGLRF